MGSFDGRVPGIPAAAVRRVPLRPGAAAGRPASCASPGSRREAEDAVHEARAQEEEEGLLLLSAQGVRRSDRLEGPNTPPWSPSEAGASAEVKNNAQWKRQSAH